MGFSSAGLDGGPPYRSVFMLARTPLVGEGHVTGVYKWREHPLQVFPPQLVLVARISLCQPGVDGLEKENFYRAHTSDNINI